MAPAGFPSLSNTRYEDLRRDFGENDPKCSYYLVPGKWINIRNKEVSGAGVQQCDDRTGKDGKTWRCQRTCRKTLSIRSGTFFEGSTLLISTIIKFIYNWADEILDYKLAKREFKMGTHAFVDWKSFLRDICAEHFIRYPAIRVGGPGVTVEIDESVFL